MKFNVNKITSVTLLASMVLSVVLPSALPVMAYGSGTEAETMAAVEIEGAETEAAYETIEEAYVMTMSETESCTLEDTVTAESDVMSEEMTD